MPHHLLDSHGAHPFWDNALPPRLHVAPGDTVVVETTDASGGQIVSAAPSRDLRSVTFSPIRPLSGPIYVDGARPGDALAIEIVDIAHHGWGWNAVLPGSGLLGDDFDRPYLHHYRLQGGVCHFSDDIPVPFSPFCGAMGVAPAQAGRFDTVPPRSCGPSLDVRQLTPGARVVLPVRVRGALFSCGAARAAQGRGDINGTGIEAPMSVSLRFTLHRAGAASPPASLPGRPPRSLPGGLVATSADGPDLYESARRASRRMLEILATRYRLSPEQAYCLCGAAGDILVEELGGEAGWRVSARLPRAIVEKRIAA